MIKLPIKLTTVKNDGVRKYYHPMFFNRFIQIIRHASFKKAHVLVSYGKKTCNFGCKCEFTNDGWYDNKPDLIKATKSFLEN